MTAAHLDLVRTILFLALAGIIAVASLTRLDFLIIKGGLQADQLEWAAHNYGGGLTLEYLKIRNAILSWTQEPRPWVYLPGYAALLAILYEVGVEDLAFVRFAQIVIDSLAILPLYFVLHRIGSSALFALLGCLTYAMAPWWAVGSAFLPAEALLPALVIALLAALVLIRDRASRAVHWLLLGMSSSLLPYFRSEMMLLFGPLAVWALLVAPERRRLMSAASVVAGFALPLVLWAVRNYYIHDHFILTPPVKWYAAWSGLGQVANDFGYFVDDRRAEDLLASEDIRYDTLESERFWFKEYVAAWVNHPGHVLRTILFRLGKIWGQPDTQATFIPPLLRIVYQVMAFITPISLIWLLHRRRWSDAFLIALLLLYALGILGPLYVEPRYVRYAGLTYLLVLPVLLGDGVNVLLAAWPRSWRSPDPQRLKSIVGAATLTVAVIGTAFQLVATTREAQAQSVIARLDLNSFQSPASRLDDITFRPMLPAVEVSPGEQSGLRLRVRAPAGSHLLAASIGAGPGEGSIIRYRVKLLRGSIGFGVLSADPARRLSNEMLSADSGGEIEGAFVSAVEPGSQFVIDAQGADDEIDAVVSKLEWTPVCSSAGLFDLFIHRTTVSARACVARSFD